MTTKLINLPHLADMVFGVPHFREKSIHGPGRKTVWRGEPECGVYPGPEPFKA